MSTELSAIPIILSCVAVAFSWAAFRHKAFEIEERQIDRLLQWHSSVVEVLIQLRPESGVQTVDKNLLLARLSAMIECGRFLLPNIVSDEYGKDKPPAYRGHRNVVLDFLVSSYNLLRKDDVSKHNAELLELQRHFTSTLFEYVVPKKRLRQLWKMTGKYFYQDRIYSDFMKNNDVKLLLCMWDSKKVSCPPGKVK